MPLVADGIGFWLPATWSLAQIADLINSRASIHVFHAGRRVLRRYLDELPGSAAVAAGGAALTLFPQPIPIDLTTEPPFTFVYIRPPSGLPPLPAPMLHYKGEVDDLDNPAAVGGKRVVAGWWPIRERS